MACEFTLEHYRELLRAGREGGFRFATFGDGWKQMVDAKCFNDDVASVGISQAWDKFAAGEVAMTHGTDGGVRQWAKDLGEDKIMVSRWPVYGSGALKDVYNATQSTSYFVTSWSEHQQEAADFLAFLHTPEQLDAWFAATGVPPADDRFDTSKITDPLDKQLYEFNTTGPQIWHHMRVKVDGRSRTEKFPRRPTYEYQLEAFCAAVLRGEPTLTPPADSIANMRVLDAIYLAAGMTPRGT